MGWFGGGDKSAGGSSGGFESGDAFDASSLAAAGGHAGAGMGAGGNQAMMSQVQQEIQAQELQVFITTVRDKCFDVCITRPGSSLGSGETNCLARCFDRYVEATKEVSQSVFKAMQNGAQGM